MDGGFSSVTFICSKTDDISLEEAQDSLGLEDEMGPDWAEMDQLVKKQRSMKKRLEEMKDSKAVYGEVMNDVDEQIEVWVCTLSASLCSMGSFLVLEHARRCRTRWMCLS